MTIAVKATPLQKEEWLSKPVPGDVTILWVDNDVPEADAYFDLSFETFGPAFSTVTNKPVFVSAVIQTLPELGGNISRINAWNGFLRRDTIEVVTKDNEARTILQRLGWKYQQVPDVAGMIAPRVISMIINEAYFALGDDVSTKPSIDTAMKLGTNYPYGPFEWSEKIGLHNIYRLLVKLGASDERYLPAPALTAELKMLA